MQLGLVDGYKPRRRLRLRRPSRRFVVLTLASVSAAAVGIVAVQFNVPASIISWANQVQASLTQPTPHLDSESAALTANHAGLNSDVIAVQAVDILPGGFSERFKTIAAAAAEPGLTSEKVLALRAELANLVETAAMRQAVDTAVVLALNPNADLAARDTLSTASVALTAHSSRWLVADHLNTHVSAETVKLLTDWKNAAAAVTASQAAYVPPAATNGSNPSSGSNSSPGGTISNSSGGGSSGGGGSVTPGGPSVIQDDGQCDPTLVGWAYKWASGNPGSFHIPARTFTYYTTQERGGWAVYWACSDPSNF